MKNEIKYINKKKVTIIDNSCDCLDNELPEEIDFSKLKQINNPIRNYSLIVTLEPDVAKHFKSSKQLNQFLRLQLRSLEKITLKPYSKNGEE